MRAILCVVLACFAAMAQDPGPNLRLDPTRAVRERGSFYLNGVGHQYVEGVRYTVVAAAIPILGGKYFGLKVRVLNRSGRSVNVAPDAVLAEDSVGGRRLELQAAGDIADRLRRQPAWAHIAGMVAGEPPGGQTGGTGGVPTMADLLRELTREAGNESFLGTAEAPYPTLTVRGTPQATGKDSPACDLACQLRNREVSDTGNQPLPQRSARPEQLEKNELLANTIPPEGDLTGVLYFSMPKLTDRSPVSRNGRKSYLVTVTVPVGEEKFQFCFPPE